MFGTSSQWPSDAPACAYKLHASLHTFFHPFEAPDWRGVPRMRSFVAIETLNSGEENYAMWNIASRTCVLRCEVRIRSQLLCWAPDGTFFCVSQPYSSYSASLHKVTLHNAVTGRNSTIFTSESRVRCTVWHPCCHSLLLGCDDQTSMLSFVATPVLHS